MPSRTMACASRVAVVVPSPVRSLVLLATSLTNCAPMFFSGLDSSISRAIETPSLVIMRRAGQPLEHDVAALGPERHLDRVGELVDARRQQLAGLVVEEEDLSHVVQLLSLSAPAGMRMPRPCSRPPSRSAIASLIASSGYVLVCSVTLPCAVSVISSTRSA